MVCGTRGSFPQCSDHYKRYGRNTSCYYVDCSIHLFLDAGTGIIEGGKQVKDNKDVHILLSHLHLDHILGLLECDLLKDEKRTIHIYGEARKKESLKQELESLISPPFWPLALSAFPAKIIFHEIEAGQCFSIGSLHIKTKRAIHPDQSVLFLLEENGQIVGYCSDHEIRADKKEETVSFFSGCKLVLFDGGDLPSHIHEGWGHSSWKEGIAFKKKASVDRLLIVHYGYDCDDEILKKEEDEAGKEEENCLFAYEGMEIDL